MALYRKCKITIILQAFNLSFTIILSKARHIFCTEKQNEPFKAIWQANEHK